MTTYSTQGSIGYLDRLDLYKNEKPYASSIVPWNTPGAKVSNLRISYHPCAIHDMRDSLEPFSVDVQGFELDKFPMTLSVDQLAQQEDLRKLYFPEAEAYLKDKFGSQLVHIFDATVRDLGYEGYDEDALRRNEQIMGAARDAHVDQTPESVLRRLKRDLPDQFDALKTRRIRVINIWRPLVEPLRDHPLALCDWRTTSPGDYVPCDLPSLHFIGEVLEIHENPSHLWWFASNMTLDEVMLIKMYDSEAENSDTGIAMCTPHCSFDWEDAPGQRVPRRSMEIRAILVN